MIAWCSSFSVASPEEVLTEVSISSGAMARATGISASACGLAGRRPRTKMSARKRRCRNMSVSVSRWMPGGAFSITSRCAGDNCSVGRLRDGLALPA